MCWKNGMADLCQLSATPEGHGSILQGSFCLQFLCIDNPRVESPSESDVRPDLQHCFHAALRKLLNLKLCTMSASRAARFWPFTGQDLKAHKTTGAMCCSSALLEVPQQTPLFSMNRHDALEVILKACWQKMQHQSSQAWHSH